MTPLFVLLAGTVGSSAVTALARGPSGLRWSTALRHGLAAMFFVTGTSHFVGLREDLIAIVPPGLPAPEFLVTATGLLELLGAAALLWRGSASWSAAGLGALMVVMFPANVHAALSDVQVGGEPATALPVRAALQLLYVGAAAAVWAAHRRDSAVSAIAIALPVAVGPSGPDRAQASPLSLGWRCCD